MQRELSAMGQQPAYCHPVTIPEVLPSRKIVQTVRSKMLAVTNEMAQFTYKEYIILNSYFNDKTTVSPSIVNFPRFKHKILI